MIDYSIESSFERIDNSQTKQYFQEVLSSYQTGNYRSAVVMLWSVIICDLIYKLQHLRDIDSDTVAQGILTDVEAKQKANPDRPDWEMFLLKSVKDKTELLDTSDFINLTHIQQIRHLSAHPVLSNVEDLLFSPYKEQVRSFIRIALESVLTKPPVFLKNIVSNFVIDVASKKDSLPDDNSLKRYLESKYFRGLRPGIEDRLFRALWKFVFKLENDDANINRRVNDRCLRIIFERRPNEIKDFIKKYKDSFSDLEMGIPLNYLLDFLTDYPGVYEILNDSARTLIEHHSNINLNNFAGSFYLIDSKESHLDKILEKIEALKTTHSPGDDSITGKTWEKLLALDYENTIDKKLKKIAIKMYIKSSSYSTADKFFDRFIEPIMNQFDEDEFVELIQEIEGNSQTYERGKAIRDHAQLIKVCEDKLPADFDESKYANFFRFRKLIAQQEAESNDS
jgi:hypothetical protein